MFRYLEQVYAVYKEQSFTNAAKKLCISQPALSTIIKKQEDALGYPIFDRSGKQITLTDVGEKYIRAATQILLIQQNFQQEIDDLVKLDRGDIVLGGTNYITSDVLPELLKSFGAKYPGIDIQIQVEQSTILHEKLEQGLVDIAIDNALTLEDGISYIPLFQEHILVGVPADLPVNQLLKDYQLDPKQLQKPYCDFSTLPKIDISILAKEEFILLKSGNKMRQISNSIFTEKGISPSVRFEFDQLKTSVSFAEGGFGVCFLTDTILKFSGPCKNLIFYQPDTATQDRQLYVMFKKNKYLSAASREFIDFLTKRFPTK